MTKTFRRWNVRINFVKHITKISTNYACFLIIEYIVISGNLVKFISFYQKPVSYKSNKDKWYISVLRVSGLFLLPYTLVKRQNNIFNWETSFLYLGVIKSVCHYPKSIPRKNCRTIKRSYFNLLKTCSIHYG